MDRISLTLPYPPSVNHYWQTRVLRRGAGYVPQVYVSGDGLRYQQAVAKHLNGIPRFEGRLRVQILVQPPDGRVRDLDNVLKCLLDSLTEAGVWNDDSQVDSLLVVRGDQTDGGSVLVLVEALAAADTVPSAGGKEEGDNGSVIELLQSKLFECRQLLSTAEDAWECGAWNSLVGMQQLYLTRPWYEAARKVTNEYDD